MLAQADAPACSLPHSSQRKLEVALLMALEPSVYMFDEPTAGMSAAETHDTMQLVRRIAKDLTILIVEHDMQVVMELADRITVLARGAVLAEGDYATVSKHPAVLEAYMGTEATELQGAH